jgi:hypothetical protein
MKNPPFSVLLNSHPNHLHLDNDHVHNDHLNHHPTPINSDQTTINPFQIKNTSGIIPGITPNPSNVSRSSRRIVLGPTKVSASLSGTRNISLIIESCFIMFLPGRSLICPWYDFLMVFFLPVLGSKRATAFANGVNAYNETRSCEAEGLEARCSMISQL